MYIVGIYARYNCTCILCYVHCMYYVVYMYLFRHFSAFRVHHNRVDLMQLYRTTELCHKGPSIYDVQMEGEGIRLKWTPADGEGSQRHVDIHTEN